MPVFPTGTAARLPVAPLLASPTTRETAPLLRALPSPTSSREGNGDPSAGRSEPLTAAQTDKLIAEVFARHAQSYEAADAFDDLNHALLLARERNEEVPCTGPGADAWTSESPEEQVVAADRCLDCPAMLLCKEYADLAKVKAGTWGGVTREPDRRIRVSTAPRPAMIPRPAETGLACTCGCGGETRGGWYLSGHDSSHLAGLTKGIRAGRLTLEGALVEVAHSDRLQAKLAARLR